MPTGGGSSRTVSTQELAPEQRELLGMIMPTVRDYARQDLELFPESTIAGPTGTQVAARNDILNTATGQIDPLSDQSIATARSLMESGGAGGTFGTGQLLGTGVQGRDTLGGIFNDFQRQQGSRDFLASGALLDPATNPVLAAQTEAALRPITENLTRDVLPGIQSDFVGGNMFGSSRQGIAERGAINDYLTTAGEIATNLQANNFNQGLAAMLDTTGRATGAATSGAGTAVQAGQAGTGLALDSAIRSMMQGGDLAELAFMPGMTQEAIGAMQQQENQARISEEAQRFTTEQMLPFLQAQDIANLAFGIGGGSAITDASQSPAFDPVGTGLGGLMALRFLGPMMGIPMF